MRTTIELVDTRGARLGVALARRDMTRAQLAEHLRIPASAISVWSKPAGAVRPTKGPGRGGPPKGVTTEAIATALGVTPAALEVGGPWGALVGEVEP